MGREDKVFMYNTVEATAYGDVIITVSYYDVTKETLTTLKPSTGKTRILTVAGYGRMKDAEKPEIKVKTKSPIDLIVTAPDGEIITKEMGQSPTMEYQVYDPDGDGDLDGMVIGGERKIGNYLITVVPKPNALSTDTYGLEVTAGNTTIVLATDVQISNIPNQPYIIESTETTIRVPTSSDVTALVAVTNSNTLFDRRTGQYSIDTTIKNTSQEILDNPVKLFIQNINPSISVVNADGIENGTPYFDYSASVGLDGNLSPNETSSPKRIIFSNPSRLRFTFDVKVIATLNSNNAAPPYTKHGGIITFTITIPGQSALLQSYPNPFNPEVWIPYELAESADVAIRIYDMSGRLVRTLDLGHKEIDIYATREKSAHWDGRNEIGERVASGVYFYQIKAGDFVATKKFVMLK